MTPRESALWFGLAALASVLAYEAFAWRAWGWRGFLSSVLYDLGGRWPLLPWLAAPGLALLWWHCFYRFWPFGGD